MNKVFTDGLSFALPLLIIAVAQSGYTAYFGVNVTTVTGMDGYPRGEANAAAIVDYMKEHEIHSKAVYLSLGDKEEKARNPVMATVGACIREASDILADKGIDTVLEWNPGNHFKDADLRTARAFAWTLAAITS